MILELFLSKNKHYTAVVLVPNLYLPARSSTFFFCFFPLRLWRTFLRNTLYLYCFLLSLLLFSWTAPAAQSSVHAHSWRQRFHPSTRIQMSHLQKRPRRKSARNLSSLHHHLPSKVTFMRFTVKSTRTVFGHSLLHSLAHSVIYSHRSHI